MKWPHVLAAIVSKTRDVYIRSPIPSSTMLRQSQRLLLRPTLSLSRSYATATPPHALVFIEQRGGVIDSGSLSALTAATQLGGEVTGLIVGESGEVEKAVESVKK